MIRHSFHFVFFKERTHFIILYRFMIECRKCNKTNMNTNNPAEDGGLVKVYHMFVIETLTVSIFLITKNHT